jgi:HSP90 family molecular chaperone
MQKYLRAQAVVDNDSKGNFENIFNQAVLEINPSHPIIQKLVEIQKQYPEDPNASEEGKEMIDLVFNTAALSAGYVLDNAAEYSQMVVKMMTRLSNKA